MMPPFHTIAARLGPHLGTLRGAEVALEEDWRRLLECERAQLGVNDLSAARATCEMLDRTAVAILGAAHSPAGITLAPMTIAVAALNKARVIELQQDGVAAGEVLASGAARLLDIVEDPERSVALRVNCLRHAKRLVRGHLRPCCAAGEWVGAVDERLRKAEQIVAKLAHWLPSVDRQPVDGCVN